MRSSLTRIWIWTGAVPGSINTYTRVGEVFQDQTVFYTVTGDKKRPTYIYIANRLK